MPTLHYGSHEIELTDDEVKEFTRGDHPLWEQGFVSQRLEAGFIHFVTGPGIPIWIDEREGLSGAAYFG